MASGSVGVDAIGGIVSSGTPVVAAIIALAVVIIGFGIGSRVLQRFVK